MRRTQFSENFRYKRIPTRKLNLRLLNRNIFLKRTCHLVDFEDTANHSVSKTNRKYRHITRSWQRPENVVKYDGEGDTSCALGVVLEKRPKSLDITERIETIKITKLLKQQKDNKKSSDDLKWHSRSQTSVKNNQWKRC